jgi:hypothetical protein
METLANKPKDVCMSTTLGTCVQSKDIEQHNRNRNKNGNKERQHASQLVFAMFSFFLFFFFFLFFLFSAIFSSGLGHWLKCNRHEQQTRVRHRTSSFIFEDKTRNGMIQCVTSNSGGVKGM